jgi:hypothetical protein
LRLSILISFVSGLEWWVGGVVMTWRLMKTSSLLALV